MENKELKDKIQKTIKENIAISAIKEEMNMKKNKKMFYSILSTAAMFIICIVVIAGSRIKVGENGKTNIADTKDKNQGIEDAMLEKLKPELNINQIDENSRGLTRMDADIQTIEMSKLPKEFDFIKNIKLPEGYKLEDSYNIYIRSDRDIPKYDKLHDYVFDYRKNIDDEIGNNIRLAFSEIGEPIRDYGISENDKKSTIDGVEMSIYYSKEYKIYMAAFKYNDIYFDIETNDITESELIELLESIIENVKEKASSAEDTDIGSIETK